MYKNYGDRNFFESGRLVDTEHSDTDIAVLYCEPFPDEEDLFLFADCCVCLDDDWLDWDAVSSFTGGFQAEGEDLLALKAIAAIDYYGCENFSSPYDGYRFSSDEVRERLRHHLIAHDNLVI